MRHLEAVFVQVGRSRDVVTPDTVAHAEGCPRQRRCAQSLLNPLSPTKHRLSVRQSDLDISDRFRAEWPPPPCATPSLEKSQISIARLKWGQRALCGASLCKNIHVLGSRHMTVHNDPKLSIRRVDRGEWRPLRALRLLALRTDPLAFDWTLDEELAFSDTTWQEKTAIGATSSASPMWVAVDPEGRFVGMVAVYVTDGIPNISGMWLDPAFRGRGVAGRLLDTALGWARANHPRTRIRLELNPNQVAATNLYVSRGFRFTGARRPPRIPRNEEIEAHEMVLPASDEANL